ncbi:Tyrosine--tRNA ligase, mitochondrial [Chionoecetes opilio]|uniref:Tyrosine--tRNA ligase n=1 Tax=Chionoecetes opilio TaxID=41210 RepID=A0A8J5CL53_CHIOP|nr:Tyrosine--tRNA ligase, mitochondrial [Chionoecetes opilio]
MAPLAPPLATPLMMARIVVVARSTLLFTSTSCHAHRRAGLQMWRTYTSHNILKLEDRGLWADYFPDSNVNKLIQELTRKPQTVYSGFDPTADSLHVGNLLIIMALLHCQRAGHNVIALVGGATAQIGDPSGKKSERPQLSVSEVQSNSQSILENLNRIFMNHQQYFWEQEDDSLLPAMRTENNIDWYGHLSVVEILREAGRHIRIGDMLSRTSVASRLESSEGLSFTEFSYQIGGSDQMGNIHTGYHLVNKLRDVTVTGLTTPLITNESGDKFGKSGGNPVWLDSKKTSTFDFYQFFIRVKDSEVEKYLKLLTFLPLDDIAGIMEKHKSAKRTTEALYGSQPEALAEMTKDEVEAVFKSAPSTSLLLEPGTSILDMALKAGCFLEERDGRRIIEAGGFYVNLARVTNPDLIIIPEAHMLPNGLSVVRVASGEDPRCCGVYHTDTSTPATPDDSMEDTKDSNDWGGWGDRYPDHDSRGGDRYSDHDSRGGDRYSDHDSRGGDRYSDHDSRGGDRYSDHDSRGGDRYSDHDSRGGDRYSRSSNVKPGDWDCPSCQFSNFASRTACFKCRTPKDGDSGNGDSGFGSGGRRGGGGGGGGGMRNMLPGDWICPKCQFHNFSSRGMCYKCNSPRAEGGGGGGRGGDGGSRGGGGGDLNGPRSGMRAGDWECQQCHFHNFASRDQCFKCSSPK